MYMAVFKVANVKASSLRGRRGMSKRKPKVAVVIDTKQRKKVPSNKKLASSVKSIKAALNGKKQMRRDFCDFAAVPPAPITIANTITDTRPLLFLHQAISEDSSVWSLNPVIPATGAASMDVYTAGIWTQQEFPVTQPVGDQGDGMPASYNKYDQLQYWSQSNGVQNEYYHSSSEYTMNFVGTACTGYIDVFLIHPKKSYNPSAQQDISLPLGLPGFTHLTQGSTNQYAINPQYFTCKRIKRKYFNTTAPAGTTPEERELQTNPNFDIKFRVTNHKSRRHIKAPEKNDGAAVLDSTDIPYRKQDWILISSSIRNRDSSDDNHIILKKMLRTCHWRDYYGSST